VQIFVLMAGVQNSTPKYAPKAIMVWRARFGDEHKQILALWKGGFIVYCDVVELMGNAHALGYGINLCQW